MAGCPGPMEGSRQPKPRLSWDWTRSALSFLIFTPVAEPFGDSQGCGLYDLCEFRDPVLSHAVEAYKIATARESALVPWDRGIPCCFGTVSLYVGHARSDLEVPRGFHGLPERDGISRTPLETRSLGRDLSFPLSESGLVRSRGRSAWRCLCGNEQKFHWLVNLQPAPASVKFPFRAAGRPCRGQRVSRRDDPRSVAFHAAGARCVTIRHAGQGPLPVWSGNALGRRGDGCAGLQCRAGDREGAVGTPRGKARPARLRPEDPSFLSGTTVPEGQENPKPALRCGSPGPTAILTDWERNVS
jgi:hypothetical protein